MHDQVMRYLSRQDLATLCLVSKTSRADIEPLLFSHIDWESTRDRNRTPPIITLLDIFLERPELATCVKRVVLSDGGLTGRCDYYWPVAPSHWPLYAYEGRFSVGQLHLERAADAIRNTQVPYADKWEERLRNSRIDAIISLFFSLLPSLRSLVIGLHESSPHGLIGQLFSHALINDDNYHLPTYHRLQDVQYMSEGYDRVRTSGDASVKARPRLGALIVFYLAGARSLTIGLDDPGTLKIQWPTPRPNLSALESLQLCCVHEKHLEDLLSTTKCLKKFTWHYSDTSYYNTDGAEDRPVNFRLDWVGQALRQVASTLEELTIACEVVLDPDVVECALLDLQGNWSTAHAFPKLRVLQAPFAFLCYWSPDAGPPLCDVIPRSVQTIALTNAVLFDEKGWEWDYNEVTEAIELWLGNWRVTHPDLKTIEVSFEPAGQEHPNPQRAGFEQLCRERGVVGSLTLPQA